MQPTAQNSRQNSGEAAAAARSAEPDPIAPAFASFLSALARPGQEKLPSWNDEELGDDVATLSYERALQASARYRPREWDDRSLTEPVVSRGAPGKAAATAHFEAPRSDGASAQAELKTASITIRMSQAECEQLRRRASEAGLSVSAYLRSCTLEVESLRAQVKDALAQLRPAPALQAPSDAAPSRRSWLRRLISR